MADEEFVFGGPKRTPHISTYGASVHYKMAGGDRVNVVQKGVVYKDNLKEARRYGAEIAAKYPGFLKALNKAVKPYE